MRRMHIEGRDCYISSGTKSWTVNICTPANRRGDYDWIIRMPINNMNGFRNCPGSINELVEQLGDRFGGQIECRPADVLEDAPLPTPQKPIESDWLRKAVIATEAALRDLTDEFVDKPYLHRVEHSLHVRLIELLRRHEVLSVETKLMSGCSTQLIHKEWPESVARKDCRRGNFDVAIIAPELLRECTPDDYCRGRITPPIAIEVGLNYGWAHFVGDIEKLRNSSIQHAYVVHFDRDRANDNVCRQITEMADHDKDLSIVYACSAPGHVHTLIRFAHGI